MPLCARAGRAGQSARFADDQAECGTRGDIRITTDLTSVLTRFSVEEFRSRCFEFSMPSATEAE